VRTFVCAERQAIVVNDEVVVTVLDILDEEVVLAFDVREWFDVGLNEASVKAKAEPRYTR
jgi:sRNA-binding carbon storage regulator CsrA